MILKGQKVRVTLGGTVLACATNCSLHISAQLEEASHKDVSDDWADQEVVGKAWDFSAEALAYVADSGTTIAGKTFDDVADLVGTVVDVEFTKDGTTTLRKGKAVINDYNQNWTNKQNGTYTVQGTGKGPLTKGSAS